MPGWVLVLGKQAPGIHPWPVGDLNLQTFPVKSAKEHAHILTHPIWWELPKPRVTVSMIKARCLLHFEFLDAIASPCKTREWVIHLFRFSISISCCCWCLVGCLVCVWRVSEGCSTNPFNPFNIFYPCQSCQSFRSLPILQILPILSILSILPILPILAMPALHANSTIV